MKKLLATILSLTMVLSLVSCAGSTDSSSKADATEVSSTATSSETTESEEEVSSIAEETTGTEEEVSSITDSLELLNTVWDSYTEDEKFAVAGGDTENMNSEGPGKFSIDDAAALDTAVAFPADYIEKIDDVATMVHMMNANSFTCGVYRCINPNEALFVTDGVANNISTRQWICGFPEKVLVATVDGYVISVFGATDLVDTFKTKLTAAYPSTEITTDKVIE